MQAFPDAARALGDVGLCGAALMHLEVLVGAVAEQLRAAGPEIGEPGDVLFGCRRCRPMKMQRSHVCSYFGGSVPARSATMYAAYQSGQFGSAAPIRFSCSPCAIAARFKAFTTSATELYDVVA